MRGSGSGRIQKLRSKLGDREALPPALRPCPSPARLPPPPAALRPAPRRGPLPRPRPSLLPEGLVAGPPLPPAPSLSCAHLIPALIPHIPSSLLSNSRLGWEGPQLRLQRQPPRPPGECGARRALQPRAPRSFLPASPLRAWTSRLRPHWVLRPSLFPAPSAASRPLSGSPAPLHPAAGPFPRLPSSGR